RLGFWPARDLVQPLSPGEGAITGRAGPRSLLARRIAGAGRRMSGISLWREGCRCAVSGGVPQRSLVIALVVGLILNLINQGDALFAGHRLDWTKIVLTFLVPYAVSTYGAVSYHLKMLRSGQPPSMSFRDRPEGEARNP